MKILSILPQCYGQQTWKKFLAYVKMLQITHGFMHKRDYDSFLKCPAKQERNTPFPESPILTLKLKLAYTTVV